MNKQQKMVSTQMWRMARALHSAVLAGEQNAVWSPACVASLLSVAREGASGATRKELDRLIGSVPLFGGHDCFGLEAESDWRSKEYLASSVVAVWLSHTAKPSEGFLHTCEEGAVPLTFADLGDPRVSSEITAWIAQQTHGLLAPGVNLSPEALACLVSALYIKDAWEQSFDPRFTGPRTFYALDGKMQAPFMRNECDATVLSGKSCIAVSLPLSAGAEVLLALPDRGCKDALRPLDLFERLARGKGKSELVDLSLPRFTCETPEKNLVPLLAEAGLSTVSAMDLTPMTGAPSAPAQIVHGAKLAVDEGGIEAAAYTLMEVVTGMPPKNPPKPRKIVFNRPFAVAVISRTGVPLFLGWVDKPKAWEGGSDGRVNEPDA